ncbi:MAG: DUF1415 domain-containing protein [Anaerolineae bacterium]
MKTETVITEVQKWVESIIVGLNLCPFAKREVVAQTIRFAVAEAQTEEDLLISLQSELNRLNSQPGIETTLVIHPFVLQKFETFNQFLDLADVLVEQMGLEGVFQIASFHPDYQFHGTNPNDAENFINRSPYPILHILREESVARAVAEYPDADLIPQRNIERVNNMGRAKLEAQLQACFSKE